MMRILLSSLVVAVTGFSVNPNECNGVVYPPPEADGGPGLLCGFTYTPGNVCSYGCDIGWDGLPGCKCASCGCTLECCTNEPPEPTPEPEPVPDNECNGVMYPANPQACFTTYLENNVCSRGCDDASWAGLPPCRCASCGCTMECCSN
ncbi:hypothetical protein EMIHUDRAFT_248990 [Emiliania huxleyi CCMP1516]|uniref:Antistasin-like domain-containing protein n=2 Tax=Emiliania huxleyi TaxID=2903 RepID=A0A0D3HYH0_EMIH1|nr:hypothetical protein EMIHUDRAFT_221475 [Emiliania huxleyi CCMP1516]XP_005761144.1 hypothetical protein EMIHUDRAFT_248990 [Emiliania huxleyi CCMP1516]EOD04055.1 hypothetical protein EMIHUDRAFT_221475 [Emiliania huxleyi CCMP1516]EOD08715.1 hypothetical protein EMIHUDRAFT_248990 [Emiliania huxleyi CCMP1516]|eukprot:XP_005756484.1 hypothetical protein EMIHUDRAFT_221475 [Emiliania huxleyi CCMP1516]